MKLMIACLVSLIMTTMCPTQSMGFASYKPGIALTSGTLLSAAGTLWAHKKIKTFTALSELEKNTPERKRSLQRWKIIRTFCGFISIGLAVACGRSLLKADPVELFPEQFKGLSKAERLEVDRLHEKLDQEYKQECREHEVRKQKYMQKEAEQAARSAAREAQKNNAALDAVLKAREAFRQEEAAKAQALKDEKKRLQRLNNLPVDPEVMRKARLERFNPLGEKQ